MGQKDYENMAGKALKILKSDNTEISILDETSNAQKVTLVNTEGISKNPSTEEKQDDIITAVNSDYLIEVTRGNIPGQQYINISGHNPSLVADTPENVWDYGGLYTYLSAETTLYASSTNAGDTGILVIVFGLDGDYLRVTRTVVLNGQNQVALNDGMLRVFRAVVGGTTASQGDVYIAEESTGGDLVGGVPQTASKVKALILKERQATQMAMYTAPAGTTIYSVFASYAGGKNVDVSYESRFRLFGSNFFYANAIFNLYQTVFQGDVRGVSVPEKTDFDWLATSSNEGAAGDVSLKFLVIDNE